MKDEKGLTLVEILAAIVLLNIIALLTFNIIVGGQNEHSKQVSANSQLHDLTYAMKLLTKDIRKSTVATPSPTNPLHEFTMIDKDGITIASYKFDPTANKIYRNNSVIAQDVSKFHYNISHPSIYFSIESKNTNKLDTKIYFREGA